MFLQIHTLTSYHATLLNRDDAGLAKRIPFGNAERLRVSSQCLKRHWREALAGQTELPGGLRTRHFFTREIWPRLVKDGSLAPDVATQLTRALIDTLLQSADKADAKPKGSSKKKAETTDAPSAQAELGLDAPAPSTEPEQKTAPEGLDVKQPILFGKPEADFLVSLLCECAKEGDGADKALKEKLKTDKKNFAAMLRQAGHGNLYAGIEGAMFGRFVTSEILSRSDAAVHVAHAMTVHGLDTEIDYFTVVDDLNRDEETGAAHAGDMELGSGVFYGYVNVDIPLLVSNFTGCAPQAWREQDTGDVRGVLEALIQAIATVSPGAKLGATAPYAYSDLVLLEVGTKQPRSLANAYLRALRPGSANLTCQAAEALAEHLAAQEAMFGPTATTRALATTCKLAQDKDKGSLPDATPLANATATVLDALFDTADNANNANEGTDGHPTAAL